METQTLQAEVRTESGKGPARQLRAKGMIPAVFYGPGVDTTALAVSPKELVAALRTEYRENAVLKLLFGGNEETVMVKDIQVHPVRRTPLHVDFYKVANDRPIEIRVPLTTSGRPVGVQKGGKMTVVFRDLPVRTTPDKIPAHIDVDVNDLDMGQVFTVAELKLPEGVAVTLAPDRRLVTVGEERKVEEEAGEEAVEEITPEAESS